MSTTSDPRVVVAELTHFVERVVLDVANTFRETVRALNPVDTGFSKSNWIVTGGSPARGVQGERHDVEHEASDDSMRSTAASWTLREGDVFITNNVDYVEGLDRRHRTAAGFVRLAVLRATIVGGRGVRL